MKYTNGNRRIKIVLGNPRCGGKEFCGPRDTETWELCLSGVVNQRGFIDQGNPALWEPLMRALQGNNGTHGKYFGTSSLTLAARCENEPCSKRDRTTTLFRAESKNIERAKNFI